MVTDNTSATGGTLQPTPEALPLDGRALLTYLQNWIAPLTTLDPTLVRPAFQDEPSNIPDAGTAWCSLALVGEWKADTYPYQSESDDGLTTMLQQNEEMTLLCSFYDTGVAGEADRYSRLLRDNLMIGQNREFLQEKGFDVAYVGARQTAPRTLSTRWLYRVNLPVTLRCQYERIYQVLSVLRMQGTIYTDVGIDFDVLTDSAGG